MKFHENKFLTTVAAAALALAVGACSSNGDSDDSAQTAAEAELAALQAAYGEDDLTPDAITALRDQIMMLMARAELTPAEVQALRDQITALMATTPTDIQDLNDQITALTDQVMTLMGRAEITPAALQALNDQITALMATTPTDVQALNDEITSLTEQVATLMGQVNITPDDVQDLRDQITTLTTQVTNLMAARPATVRALQEVVDAFATVRNSETDAEGAASAAADAVTTAMESLLKITAIGEGVAGDSARAEANAQAVLDAQTDANEAVDIADAAVQSAKDALVVAEALPSDDPVRDTLIAALKDAIKAAEVHAKAAADSRGDDDGDLAGYVEGITGDDPEAKGYPMTPAQHGRAVAEDIAMALVPTTPDSGARMRGAHADEAPADTFKDAVRMDDHQGSTWAEIAGTVVDKRIANPETGTTGTIAVKAALIEGQTAAKVHATGLIPAGGPEMDGKYADGVQFLGSFQNGIPGTAFCGGDDCEVDEDGDLTGSWYFTPEFPKEWYVKSTDDQGDTMWIVETLYARFGHWLDDDTGTEVNTFALSTAVKTVNLTDMDGNETLKDTSASYRGPAAGMSVEKTTDSDGEITEINSAAFVATVNLKATFGDDSTLGGTVTDFRGDATDPNWSVELQVKTFPNGTTTFDNGVTVASGRNGVWTATAYGDDGERPTGIFGGFNAHFTDGHAAGAYTTR